MTEYISMMGNWQKWGKKQADTNLWFEYKLKCFHRNPSSYFIIPVLARMRYRKKFLQSQISFDSLKVITAKPFPCLVLHAATNILLSEYVTECALMAKPQKLQHIVIHWSKYVEEDLA